MFCPLFSAALVVGDLGCLGLAHTLLAQGMVLFPVLNLFPWHLVSWLYLHAVRL
jgi:hypothetical protein